MVWTEIARPKYRRDGLRYASDSTDEDFFPSDLQFSQVLLCVFPPWLGFLINTFPGVRFAGQGDFKTQVCNFLARGGVCVYVKTYINFTSIIAAPNFSQR